MRLLAMLPILESKMLHPKVNPLPAHLEFLKSHDQSSCIQKMVFRLSNRRKLFPVRGLEHDVSERTCPVYQFLALGSRVPF